jgi:hypothetical protein
LTFSSVLTVSCSYLLSGIELKPCLHVDYSLEACVLRLTFRFIHFSRSLQEGLRCLC